MYCYCDHPHLHSFPTRRSSDLVEDRRELAADDPAAEDDESPRHLGLAEQPFRVDAARGIEPLDRWTQDRKSTRLNSSHVETSYAVFCLKKKRHSTLSDLRGTRH